MEELEIQVLNLQFAALASKAAMEEKATALSMDEPAFGSFYKQTSRALLRYLVAVTRQPDVAEDILQEAYCRLLTAGRPEMDEQQTRSYLFRMATNLVRDRWRRGKESPLPQNSEEISPMILSSMTNFTCARPSNASNRASANFSGSLMWKAQAIKRSQTALGLERAASGCYCFARGADC